MLQFGFMSKDKITVDEAILYCLCYNQPGSTGWRMPTPHEWHNYTIGLDLWVEGDEYRYAYDEKWYALPVREIK